MPVLQLAPGQVVSMVRSPEETRRMAEALQDPARVAEAYRAAVWAKNASAFAALYADDVRVFDLWGRWSYDGLAAWRATAEEWFGSLGRERVQVDVADLRTHAAGELAGAGAVLPYRSNGPHGGALRARQKLATWVMERRGGGWRIVHEHTSAPADFESGKVMLRRS